MKLPLPLPLPLPLGLQISAIDNSLVKELFRFLLHPESVSLFVLVEWKHLNLMVLSTYSSNSSASEDLAFDLSISAFLGDNIYNFGELLAHPIS
ncbi:26S proteasome regulatory subunit RPN9 [Gossypium arboreum]|uniref:26S proteasome regulatory subunit RPN9 n=1 Tax=Gossypium arboreum TaxID=29729 RepID=A0A0B0PH46_GOSAR|nr:26S proteasome regulatory subunit RPN9 [Gossypium arboreum]